MNGHVRRPGKRDVMWDEKSHYHELGVTKLGGGAASREALTRADLVFGLREELPLSGCGGCGGLEEEP